MKTDVAVTPITQDDFEAIRPYLTQTGRRTPENAAIDELLPMTGVKFPCRWAHGTSCSFGSSAYTRAKRLGFKIKYRCKDGVFSAFRYE